MTIVGRRSNRSAIAPASGPSRIAGSIFATKTPPMARLCVWKPAPAVRLPARAVSAMMLSQSPRLQTAIAVHNLRNGAWASTWEVFRRAAARPGVLMVSAYPGARLATESRASRTRPLVAEAYYGPRPIRDRITPIPDPWGGSRAARPRRPGRIAPAASRSSACHARLEQDHPTRVPIRITLRAESPGPQLDQGDLRRRADPDRRAPRPRPSGDVHLSPAAPGPGAAA